MTTPTNGIGRDQKLDAREPEEKDDVRQADESGEPRRSGWSHGHQVDDDDPAAQSRNVSNPDRPADKKSEAVGEHPESGRPGSV
jgi:hypothetical protein